VRANASAGFSVATWTGSGSGSVTVGHGLGVAPQFFIVKDRSNARNWLVYHTAMGATKGIQLNLTTAQSGADAGYWNNTAPTSTVATIGTYGNESANYVGYFWTPVSGYSAMGSFSASNGAFIYTGFRPKFLLLKCFDTAGRSWALIDTSRGQYNLNDKEIYANLSDAEYTTSNYDLVSNGFVVRSASAPYITGTWIYYAVAENPFSIARAR